MPPTLNYLIMLTYLSVYLMATEIILIAGVTTVLIGQGLLNYLANTNHVKLVVARHPTFSFISESVTSIKFN